MLRRKISASVPQMCWGCGNATGFVAFEYGLSVKWPELLKQIAPNVTGAVVIRDPAISAGIGQFSAIQGIAPTLGLDVIPSVFRPLALPRRNTFDLIALKSNHIWRRAQP